MRFALLQTREEVAAIRGEVAQLMKRVVAVPDATYLPEYFLPRLPPSARPCVVAVYNDLDLISVLYAYEARLAGLATGFVLGGDYMGRGLILAAPAQEQQLLSASCSFLLRTGIHAMRLKWAPQQSASDHSVQMVPRPARIKQTVDLRLDGDWLKLQHDYPSFLATLGPHTRRNLRYYRRKAEALGIAYTGCLQPADYVSAVSCLNKVADYPLEPGREARDLQFFKSFDQPVIVGLRTREGKFVSLISGFRSGNHLHILSQLNSDTEDVRKLSLSLVLRGYLIEEHIARGVTAVHFSQGCSTTFGRYCEPVEIQHLAIDDPARMMTTFKQACSSLAYALHRTGQRVPSRLQWAANSYYP